jgi:putative FmdB family regulatory protein
MRTVGSAIEERFQLMPTYEYQCEKCEQVFELFQSMKDDPITSCRLEGCDGKVKRLIGTGAGLIFKGSGFYITDYRSNGYKEAAKKESSGGGSSASPSPSSTTPAASSSGSTGSSTPAPKP